jgi:hypothetical protein
MVRRKIPLVFIAGLLLGSPAKPAWAGPNPDFKLILHLVPMPEKKRDINCFANLPKEPTGAVTRGELSREYLAYVLITDFSPKQGVAGVQFGISFNGEPREGVDMTGPWRSCTLYQWPMEDWPGSNTGNLLTWNQSQDCQEKSPLPVGFFTVTAYSPDRLKIIPRPVDGLARIATCGVKLLNAGDKVDNAKLESLGWADFGEGDGYNPWDPAQNPQTMKFAPIKGTND